MPGMRRIKDPWQKLTSGLYVPPYVKFAPGHPCCCDGGPCEYFADTFDSSPIGADWTVESGSWNISSGTLATSSSAALLENTVSNPNSGDSDEFVLEANVTANTNGDTVRLIGNYVDSSNYWFLELTFHSTTASSNVKLFERASGSNTQRGQTINTVVLVPSTFYTASMCFTSSGVRTMVAGSSGPSYATTSLTTSLTALGTGALNGTASFNEMSLSRHTGNRSDCSECASCTLCSGTTPAELSLVISGVVDDNCSNCDETLNGTFILSNSGTHYSTGFYLGVCQWAHEFPSKITCNNAVGIFAEVVEVGSSNRLLIEIPTADDGDWGSTFVGFIMIGFGITIGLQEQFDCDQWSDTDAPLTGTIGFPGRCTTTAGTSCTVTAN